MVKRWNQAIQDRDEQRMLKRQAVLIAGARLFHERGYHQTSLDDIAKSLGVSKPSLYYYIKNKDEIVYEIIANSLRMTKDEFAKARASKGNGLEKILGFFRSYALHLHDDFGRCAASVDILVLGNELQEKITDARTSIDREIRLLVAEGQEDGSVAALDPKLVTFYMFGAFNWIAQWYQTSGPLKPEAVADAFVAFTRRLLEFQT